MHTNSHIAPDLTHQPHNTSIKLDTTLDTPASTISITAKRIPLTRGIPLGRALNLTAFFKRFRLFRHKYRAPLTTIQRQSGHCFTCAVPEYLRSDKDGESALIVFEDSIPLASPHAVHSEIESLGEGRYSHWQGWLLFSTSDNSDPTTNGRLYTVREV